MTDRQERRTPGVNRVQVARLVDICGRDQDVPAFEAQSVELSGRGMHVRTPYLPPLGAKLVCRLEDDGNEIVVEGVVAWQRDREGGGEFGVQFTALDSGSVEALKGLCGLESGGEAVIASSARTVAQEATSAVAPSGTPVKLHIDGLGAPMKARVKTGSVRKLQVGSNLEFLKVGRGLEVEDVEQGERRGARIDAVSIAIDPETQVPQLVVMLRYAGEDSTPQPSVVDDDEEASNESDAEALRAEAASEASAPVSLDDDGEDGATDAGDEAAADAMRGRVDAFAVNVGKAAQRTSDRLAVVGGAAAHGFARWMKEKSVQIAARRSGGAQKRRSTAPAPPSSMAASPRRLRPQNGSTAPDAANDPKRRKLLIGASVGIALTIAVGAMAFTGRSKTPSQAAAPTTMSAVSAPTALPAPATPAQTATPAAQALPGQRPGIVANVPLFGPTPMATLEPAPLGPAPDQIAAVPANAVQSAAEERMDDAASDESFGDGAKTDKDKKDKSPEALAEAVKPWGQGKLHLPVLHRMKLDKPGAALDGKKEASGFTVVIPGRKIEGSGTSISKRDDRISEVRTKNGPGGAHVTFIFRSKVPGYKVRLKKNYVEFFISSPDGAK